jgi:flagellar hook-basal body complex protein FliE
MNIQGLPVSTVNLGQGATKPAEQSGEFGQALREAVSQIDHAQTEAQGKIGEVLQGNGGDLHSAMIAVEKADLSFQLMLQVRNKIVAAYQEVSRMNF